MQNQNVYWAFPGVLSNDFCDYIIKEGQKRNIVTGETGGQRQKQNEESLSQEDKTNQQLISSTNKTFHVRDSKVSWIRDTHIFDTVFEYVKRANTNAGWNYDIEGCEDAQFTIYEAPTGFYGWHNDGGSCHKSKYKRHIPGVTDSFRDKTLKLKSGFTMDENLIGNVRKLSVTISLTDSETYEGGNLKFDWGEHAETKSRFHECTEIRPRGSVIVFPSYYYHQVTPVTKGTRYSLVIWYHGKPFR